MSKQKRSMPSEQQIRRHWVPLLRGKKSFADVVHCDDDNVCFACGYPFFRCERAHIKARSDGGEDAVENLHMLCPICHKNSEMLDGEKYWDWFNSRTMLDTMVYVALKSGMNVGSLFGLKSTGGQNE